MVILMAKAKERDKEKEKEKVKVTLTILNLKEQAKEVHLTMLEEMTSLKI